MSSRLVAISAGLLLAVSPVAALADNTAVVVNTKDNSSAIKIAFKIERVMKDSVTTSNAAVAVSSCSACETVAIAIDAVFVMTDPHVYTPTNVAIAYNVNCSGCSTLADAYQFVITTGNTVHLTPEGSQETAQIRQQLEALRRCSCSIYDIQQQVAALAAELQQVLSNEVVPAEKPASQPAPEASTAPTPAASPSAGSGTPSPAASPSPSPSATPSASPTP